MNTKKSLDRRKFRRKHLEIKISFSVLIDIGILSNSIFHKLCSVAKKDYCLPLPWNSLVKGVECFFCFILKWAYPGLFFGFIFVLLTHHNLDSNLNWKKCWWCAWDLNLGWQDGRREQIHWAMVAPQRSWMFVSAQLPNKFDFCPMWIVFIIFVIVLCLSLDGSIWDWVLF